MEDYNLIVEILEDILGDSQRHHPGKGQIAIDCPVCSYDIKGLDKGDGKGVNKGVKGVVKGDKGVKGDKKGDKSTKGNKNKKGCFAFFCNYYSMKSW